MSGDHGLRVSLPASLQVLRANPAVHIHLVGRRTAIERGLAEQGIDLAGRLHIEHAEDVLPMDIGIVEVLRRPLQSSMHVALGMLAARRVNGTVSAGHTGALMALARKTVHMMPGFSRPAACSALPVRTGATYMLDLGANVDCSPDQLVDFALMGSALAASLEEIDSPRVALLSNGSEENKGNDAIRLAAQALKSDERINFVGFVEGDDLFGGEVEVIVCDGLMGNVALKVAEGTAAFAADLIRARFGRHWWGRFLARVSSRQLSDLNRSLSAELHGGALLLGLKSVVVKSHGAAGVTGFAAAIQQAAACVECDIVRRFAPRAGVR